MSRYEYKDEKSHKFWEITVEGDHYVVRYGRVGTDGRLVTKRFSDQATAQAAAAKIAKQKVKKGYVGIASESTGGAPDAAVLIETQATLDADVLRAWLGGRTMTIVKFQDYETTFDRAFDFSGWLHSDDDDERCDALSDLGLTGDGSRVVAWHRAMGADAVLYFGSGGGQGVLAASLTDWVAAIALGIQFGGFPGDACYLANEPSYKFEIYDEEFMESDQDPKKAQALFRHDAVRRFGPLSSFDAIVSEARKLNEEFAAFVAAG